MGRWGTSLAYCVWCGVTEIWREVKRIERVITMVKGLELREVSFEMGSTPAKQ